MLIEIGRSYQTRGGQQAVIRQKRDGVFVGDIIGGPSSKIWQPDGTHGSRHITNIPVHDLIAEWTETPHEGVVATDNHDQSDVILPTVAMPRSIYLSGPVTGYPYLNYPLFNAVAMMLRAAGHRVYNPAEFGITRPYEGFPIREGFAEFSKFICEEADLMILLPGWETSPGANVEFKLAEVCGIETVPFTQLSIAITTEGTF